MRLREIQYARKIDRLKRAGKLPTIEELSRIVLAVRQKYSYRIRRARREAAELQEKLQRKLFQ